ncbi:MAG: hypothetical protein WC222_00235 [Parachlamydiales bacterium]|jgi:hypothetical protein
MFNKIILNLLFSVLVFTTSLSALPFNAGSTASYNLSQKALLNISFQSSSYKANSDCTIGFDVKILKDNNGSYPLEVEFILRHAYVDESQVDGLSVRKIYFDSKQLPEVENINLANFYNKLLNHPLTFKIDGEFQVTEISGYLEELSEDFSSPSQIGLLGTTPSSFEFLFTQLFHLADQTLVEGKSYPVSSYQLLNWEDEPLNEKEYEIQQTSIYQINSIRNGSIEGVWKAESNLIGRKDDCNGNVSLESNVSWDMNNPLKQTRHLDATIEESSSVFVPVKILLKVEQDWQAL